MSTIKTGLFRVIDTNGRVKTYEIRGIHTSKLDGKRYILVKDPVTGSKDQIQVRNIRKLEAA